MLWREPLQTLLTLAPKSNPCMVVSLPELYRIHHQIEHQMLSRDSLFHPIHNVLKFHLNPKLMYMLIPQLFYLASMVLLIEIIKYLIYWVIHLLHYKIVSSRSLRRHSLRLWIIHHFLIINHLDFFCNLLENYIINLFLVF